MSRIRSENTKPEIIVRKILHRLGYRFRLHRSELPGTPDLVLPKYRVALFVHGCYWHRHYGCKFAYTPKSNQPFWHNKFLQNVERDKKVREDLERMGWRTVIIWECETKEESKLINLIRKQLR